jgi:hypothetical protein
MRDLTPRSSRRDVLRWLTGAGFLAALRGKAQSAAALSWPEAARLGTHFERRYRADAVVVVFSIPLLHRSGVGGGSVNWGESAEADGNTLRSLEFLGYSDPKRAAGLNRLGFIREFVRLHGGHVEEALYFGLMTSSPEENAEDARRALHSTAADSPYSVIQGRVAAGDCTSTGAHFVASAKFTAAQKSELETLARKALESARALPAQFDARGATPAPFLESLAELLPLPGRNEGRYVYGGRLYHLWLRQDADSKATAYFRGRHMTTAEVVRVSGKLRREAGSKEWEFRVWIEKGSPHPLPLRIEYQAKSYLRLVFEAEG